jgi:hypothetical protein
LANIRPARSAATAILDNKIACRDLRYGNARELEQQERRE